MSKNKKGKRRSVLCPYCGRQAVLRPASFVYGYRAKDEFLYVCANYPACNSYVGAHAKTMEPMGALANGDLRHRRIQAHRSFDRIWKTGIMTRAQAYQWLRFKFGLTRDQAHIGQFSDYYCEQVITCSEELLKNNHQASIAS